MLKKSDIFNEWFYNHMILNRKMLMSFAIEKGIEICNVKAKYDFRRRFINPHISRVSFCEVVLIRNVEVIKWRKYGRAKYIKSKYYKVTLKEGCF